MASQPTERLGFIEGFRGIAALYVVLQHICTLVDPQFLMRRPGAQPSWLAGLMGWLWFGHFAVAAFIVLSGFCLQMSLYHKGDGQLKQTRKFLIRRCWRILPPYYACLMLSLVVCFTVTQHQTGLPWSQYLPVTPENTLAHVFMVHNLSRDWMYKINGVLWSISIEFQLYFAFPILAAVLWRWGAAVALGSISSLVGLLLLMQPGSEKLYPWYAALFVLGMCGARWAFDRRIQKQQYRWMLCLGLFSLGLSVTSIQWTKELMWRDALMGVAIMALLIAGVLRPQSRWAALFGSKPLLWLGSFSYSLYLIHHPILQVLYVNRPLWASTVTRQVGFLMACLPIILALSYVFYLAFERPFIGFGKQKAAQMPENAP